MGHCPCSHMGSVSSPTVSMVPHSLFQPPFPFQPPPPPQSTTRPSHVPLGGWDCKGAVVGIWSPALFAPSCKFFSLLFLAITAASKPQQGLGRWGRWLLSLVGGCQENGMLTNRPLLGDMSCLKATVAYPHDCPQALSAKKETEVWCAASSPNAVWHNMSRLQRWRMASRKQEQVFCTGGI